MQAKNKVGTSRLNYLKKYYK